MPENFRSSRKKLAYAYLLTPCGISKSATLTKWFLNRRTVEWTLPRAAIELLRSEADQLSRQL